MNEKSNDKPLDEEIDLPAGSPPPLRTRPVEIHLAKSYQQRVAELEARIYPGDRVRTPVGQVGTVTTVEMEDDGRLLFCVTVPRTEGADGLTLEEEVRRYGPVFEEWYRLSELTKEAS